MFGADIQNKRNLFFPLCGCLCNKSSYVLETYVTQDEKTFYSLAVECWEISNIPVAPARAGGSPCQATGKGHLHGPWAPASLFPIFPSNGFSERRVQLLRVTGCDERARSLGGHGRPLGARPRICPVTGFQEVLFTCLRPALIWRHSDKRGEAELDTGRSALKALSKSVPFNGPQMTRLRNGSNYTHCPRLLGSLINAWKCFEILR